MGLARLVRTLQANLGGRTERPLSACTIVARNYLSQARIFAESFLEHEAGTLYIVVVDGLTETIDMGPRVRFLDLNEIGLPHQAELCFKYDVTELCTAVKPSLLSYLLLHCQEEQVAYFDPDIVIQRHLTELHDALQVNSLVLIPHITSPIPLDGLKPSEQDILIAGAYNLGFIAVRRSPTSEAFLGWWIERLEDLCCVNPAAGLFVDQKWIDLVPGLFPDVGFLRDETYDVAYWNLHARVLDLADGRFLVNGRPLAFFHYSGYVPRDPLSLSKHQTRIRVVEGSPLDRLLTDYRDLQERHGYNHSSQSPYGFSRFDDGTPVLTAMRHIYRDVPLETRREFGNPFQVGGNHSFLAWVTRSTGEHDGLSPLLLAVYRERRDLQAAFPDVRGRDQQAFLEWARTCGCREMGCDRQLLDAKGRPLSHFLQSIYRDRRDLWPTFPDPREHDREGFIAWARDVGAREMGYEPGAVDLSSAAAINECMSAVYRSRPDLQENFPHVHGADREAFLEWALTQGATEYGFEPELVDDWHAPALNSFLLTLHSASAGLRSTFPRPLGEDREAYLEWARTTGAQELGYDQALVDDPTAPGLSPLLSMIYRSRPDIQVTFPDPEIRQREAFLEWARIHGAREYGFDPRWVDEPFAPALPTPVRQPLSPLLSGVYRMRPDVRAAYPDPEGKDREGFLAWARNSGVKEMGLDPRAIDDPDAPAFNSSEMAEVAAGARQAPETRGVNVSGYLRNETGLGAVARGYVAALATLRVPVALNDFSTLSPNRSEDPTLSIFDDENPYAINLICANADHHPVYREHLGETYFRGKYNIGVWFWEMGQFPLEWRDRFAYYDELWAASTFIASALSAAAPIPIVRVPPVITTGPQALSGSRSRGRRRLGLARKDFVFSFIFDFNSVFERKNPLAVLEAFRAAFAPNDSVRLIVKVVNEKSFPEGLAAMQQKAEGYPISIYCGYWSAQDMRDLTAATDAYVSLHRAEGFGLTMADAMAHGKPVIATAWSGNMDFMNVGNSLPVRYRLRELTEDHWPYRAGQVWADPSIDHAAELMRSLFLDHDKALAIGEAGRRDIERDYSPEAVGRLIGDRIAIIQSRQRGHAATVFSAGHSGTAQRSDSVVNVDRRVHEVLRVMRSDVATVRHTGAAIDAHLGEIAAQVELQAAQIEELRAVFDVVREREETLGDSLRTLQQENAAAHARECEARTRMAESRLDAFESEQVQRAADLALTGEQLGRRLDELERTSTRLSTFAQRFSTRPYMAQDAFGAFGDLAKPMEYGVDSPRDSAHAPSVRFANRFRGAEPFIVDRQRTYLEIVQGCERILDLGCGRGEFLGLLAEHGMSGVGVDLDSEAVCYCRSKGLEAVSADAIAFLRDMAPGTFDGVFSAQFIEHIDLAALQALLSLVREKLRPGGVFVAETVNPECIEALRTFHVDLTHQRPIYPQVLLHMCQEAGFSRARIFYPLGGGFTQKSFETVGEYAVVAHV